MNDLTGAPLPSKAAMNWEFQIVNGEFGMVKAGGRLAKAGQDFCGLLRLLAAILLPRFWNQGKAKTA